MEKILNLKDSPDASSLHKPVLPSYLVLFTLDDLRFAINTLSVIRIIHLVDIIPLPKAPEIVLGVINMHGMIIPVVNIRERFHLKERKPVINDKIVIVQSENWAEKRGLGIIVDEVNDVIEYDESKLIAPEQIISGIGYVEGVLKLQDGIVLIHDINKFLSIEEDEAIENAVKAPLV